MSRRKTEIIDESSALLTMAALRLGADEVVDVPNAQYVLAAIRRSTLALGDDASIDAIADYVQDLDDGQLPGMINNVKGIAFEIQLADFENNDGDSMQAYLHEDTNHPGSDLVMEDSITGSSIEIQLKATDSAAYVQSAMDRNPEVLVVTTSEVAAKVPGAYDSGISNAELTGQVEDTVEALGDHGSHPLLAASECTGAAAGLAASLRAVPILHSWKRGEINRAKAKSLLLKNCGAAAAKAGVLALALHTPLAPVAAIYISYRLIRRGGQVVKEHLSKPKQIIATD